MPEGHLGNSLNASPFLRLYLPEVLQKEKPKSERKYLKLTELKILEVSGGW